MARAIWTGALAFGLVNVPVGLYSATQDKTIRFHQFERGTSSRIRYKRVNEDTGEEVGYSDIVKGADLGGGDYVILTPEELEAVEPGQTRTIDISDFVEASEIDPIYYQRTYYLAPQDEAGERAYALLVRAMREAGRVGIATFVMRSKQYLAAIRPKGDVLTLETMFFADEIRDPVQEIDQLPADREIGKRDLDMATSLIDTMTTTWDPESYRDTYRERVEELIEAKRNDEEIVTDTGPQEAGQVVDLMDALRASVEQARGRRQHRDTEPEPATGDGRDLAELTKGELYDLAQELDIPGRSSMSRSDLAEAVKQASPRQRAS